MIKINLLPKIKKSFFSFDLILAIGIIIFLIDISAMYYIYYNQHKKNNTLQKRIVILDNDIATLEKTLKVIDLIEKNQTETTDKVKTLLALSNTSGEMAICMDEFSNLLPQDIWITNLKQDNKKIFFSGNSISKDSIDILLQKIYQNRFFTNFSLLSMKEENSENKTFYKFELEGYLKN